MRRETQEMTVAARHSIGTMVGYLGMVIGGLSVLSAASEFGAYSTRDSALLILGFMIAFYAIGWVLAPLLNALYGPRS